jgi:diguanylate cyclase (GGDEF)-like protein
VLTSGGRLLEHFARLAANVAGTSAAVVGVRGRRKGPGLKRAACGLSREQLTAVNEIDEILDSGAALTVVPDLTRDDRFSARTDAFEHFRFLVHLKLISPGGEHVGFICLLDEESWPGLTEAQIASLGHIASMITADRQREQRHRHLMHVADRALRVDRMLRLVSDAASCADALTSLLEALCHFHGAAVGQILRLIDPDKPLVEISRYHQDQETGSAFQAIEPLIALTEMTMGAIRRNKPNTIKFSHFEAPEGPGDPSASGFVSHVCIPVWVQQQRFGISLAFATDEVDLDSVVADITALADTIRPALFQKVTEERMRFAAHHDDLTQLSNRLMFQERLRKAIAGARSVEQRFAVLCLDLDGFKLINDTRGHEIGDRLLVGVAQRLRESVRETDTVARMGGDEFAIIQPLDSQPSAAIALAKRLVETVAQPFDLSGRPALVGVSIGIALYPDHGENPDLLLRNADQALYRAKKAGRKTFRLFDPAMGASHQEHPLVEQDLRDAIRREDFTLAYQPVCDCKSSQIVGFEALLRWRHPLIGSIQPDQFIPLAEKSGLIVPLGRWALEEACVEAATWDPPVFLSVNLSPLQFRQPDLPQQIAGVLSRTGLPATRLALEVTEGLLLDESDLVLRTMRALQQQGIRITLDDFGTAYASMSYLRRFPFNGIKIDKSFIRALGDDKVTLAIVRAILSLGEQLDLDVVAEGVETESELDILRNLGCRFVQGYLLGRPSESELARAMLLQAGPSDCVPGRGVEAMDNWPAAPAPSAPESLATANRVSEAAAVADPW